MTLYELEHSLKGRVRELKSWGRKLDLPNLEERAEYYYSDSLFLIIPSKTGTFFFLIEFQLKEPSIKQLSQPVGLMNIIQNFQRQFSLFLRVESLPMCICLISIPSLTFQLITSQFF